MRDLTPEEWERIEAPLGIRNRDPALREKMLGPEMLEEGLEMLEGLGMLECLEWAFSDLLLPRVWPNIRTSPEYRRAHAALKKQAQKARQFLADADWRTVDLDQIILRIDDIAPDAVKSGRRPDCRLQMTIYKLGRLYSRWTDRKPGISRNSHGKPSGPFFTFVRECLRALVPEALKSDEALASEIRRALRLRVRATI